MLRKFSDIKHAIYINLDSRTDRRELFEKQFEELHGRYPQDFTFAPVARFSAIRDVDNGAIGCTKSHIECIQIAKNNGWDHVLIFEDDALLIHPEVLVHQVSSFLSRFRDEWDVILFSGNNFPPFKIEAPDCFRIANCQTTGCYVVGIMIHYSVILKKGLWGSLRTRETRQYMRAMRIGKNFNARTDGILLLRCV